MDTQKTIVIGLGNPILTDDGVGVLAARQLEQHLSPELPSWLTITEAGVGGLRLMELTLGYQRVVLIDAWYLDPDRTNPGKIHQLSLDDLRSGPPTQHSTSAHDTSLVTALDTARALGYPVAEQFSVFAVEVENILEFGEEPTTQVAQAIPRVVELVLAELGLAE
ncbi:MAG: hydrogenase maturation protease [Anaerolineales bacterium]